MSPNELEYPANLPSIRDAKLPVVYQKAKEALAQCSAIDECQQWADKAKALASYAKQAKDDQLQKLAMRIQARAIRRCGELLKTYDARGEHRKNGGDPTSSQREAAKRAGLSKDQQVTAVRVANIPAEDFTVIESANPPTVTALAEAGKKTRPISLNGIDPRDFAISTDGQDRLRGLAEFAHKTDPAIIARGARPAEHKGIREHIRFIDTWLDELFVRLED